MREFEFRTYTSETSTAINLEDHSDAVRTMLDDLMEETIETTVEGLESLKKQWAFVLLALDDDANVIGFSSLTKPDEGRVL